MRRRESNHTGPSDRSGTTTLALVGNPNCGKTTIFNALTGGKHRIGNWPGVTVEKKEGVLRMAEPGFFLAEPFIGQGEVLDMGHTRRPQSDKLTGHTEMQITLVDLPGIYSLTAHTEDERVARNYLVEEQPDGIINILDASNLERNLYLTLQLIELGIPLIVVLNMIDISQERGITIDAQGLSARLGVPVIPVQGTNKTHIRRLSRVVTEPLTVPDPKALPVYSPALEDWIQGFTPLTAGSGVLTGDSPAQAAPGHPRRPGPRPRRLAGAFPGVPSPDLPRWTALQFLENADWIQRRLLNHGYTPREVDAMVEARKSLETTMGEEADILSADEKYRIIEGLTRETINRTPTRESLTDRIDRIVMHRLWGIPIFMGVMYLVFWVTITLGSAFIDFFDLALGALLVEGLGQLLWSIGSPQWLTEILANGIGSGLQTVGTFIPIIFFMFFMLSILEDSGYMARAAFVMDRFMQFLGLPGKAFIPMIVGFGCTVPGIMGTRTLESTKDRYTTIFMTPFMSCGARLPVYALFVAALFPRSSGSVVFSIYLVGIILAVLTGILLKHTLFRGASSHFVMELPPYHSPRLGYVVGNSLDRVKSFVIRAGSVIALAVAVLSLLNSLAVGPGGMSFGNQDSEDSLLSVTSRAITPVFAPMGIESENWPATVGLFTGVFAKEAIVGTLNSLYAQDSATDGRSGASPQAPFDTGHSLGDRLLEAVVSIPINLAGILEALLDPLGFSALSQPPGDEQTKITTGRLARMFTPASGYAYLLFVLIYTPCLAAMGAAIREMGRLRGLGLGGYLLVLAWAVAVLFYQVFEGGDVGWILTSLGLMAGMVVLFWLAGRSSSGFRPQGIGS